MMQRGGQVVINLLANVKQLVIGLNDRTKMLG